MTSLRKVKSETGEVVQDADSDWELSEKKTKGSNKDPVKSQGPINDQLALAPTPPHRSLLAGVGDIKVRVKPSQVWILDDKQFDHTHRFINDEEFPVVFRVLTTAQRIYRVHPAQAVVDGKTFIDIKITRKASPVKSDRFDIQVLHYDVESLPRDEKGEIAISPEHRLNWFFRLNTVHHVVNIRYRQRPPWDNVLTDMPKGFPISKELSALCAQAIPRCNLGERITVDALALLLDALETGQ